MKINRLNLGEEIRKKVEAKRMSKAEFAKRLNIARQNIEKTVFQKHSLDTDLLCNISEVLECNFFNYYTSDKCCNNIDYVKQEVKAVLSIEVGREKQEQVFRFTFGDNNIEILNK